MRLYGIGTLRRWTRRVWLATQSRAVILLYHRVAELSSDPQLLSVTPQHFAEHLEHICEYYHPMSLIELCRSLAAKHVPHRAVVITFDDGYADNLWNAKPLLERYDVPATIFVTTGHVGQNREFWWDELERLLFLPERLPETLTLNIDGELYEWSLRENEEQRTWKYEYSDTALPAPSSMLRWDVTMEICPSPRYKVYKELHHLLRPLDDKERKRVLTALSRWAGLSRDGRPAYRVLNHSELKALGDCSLIEIGSHSITHPVLSTQPLELQSREIVESKRFLEDILGYPVNSFSYPYGGTGEVSEETVRLIREAGYEMACANFSALVTGRSSPYWLPRYLVRDWGGEEFAHRLRRLFRG